MKAVQFSDYLLQGMLENGISAHQDVDCRQRTPSIVHFNLATTHLKLDLHNKDSCRTRLEKGTV
jgi:hypothetical protein